MTYSMEKILRRVYASPRTTLALGIISRSAVVLSVMSYALILLHHFMIDKMDAVGIIVASAVPFVIVSILRRLINAKRPYELYNFYDVPPKKKTARSFPSRHAFSIFLIATLAFTVSPGLSIVLLLLGVSLSLSRVLLGVHFIRDVVAGALIGVVSGLLGIFIVL